MAKQGKQRRERRRGGVPPGIRVVRDAEEVFRAAILAGVLSAERTARNWAEHYLYLFHDENGTAWFKHRDSRAHVSMTARRRGLRFGVHCHRGRLRGRPPAASNRPRARRRRAVCLPWTRRRNTARTGPSRIGRL